MLRNKKASNPSNFPCPDVPCFKKLNAILSWGTDLKNFKELLSWALDFAYKLKDVISGPVTTFLKDMEQVSVVTAGLLVVAYNLERFDYLSTNKEKCWTLIKEMSDVVTVVKRFKESPKGMEDVIQDAIALIVEGAYSTLVLQKDQWPSEAFEEMRYVCAYDALPCKDPFLDLCSFSKGWAWDNAEEIVGKDKLEMLESRALVTRTTNGVSRVQDDVSRVHDVILRVHDVILTLARQMSNKESKRKTVRKTFTSASKLKDFLQEENAHQMKDIWLSENKDALEIFAETNA